MKPPLCASSTHTRYSLPTPVQSDCVRSKDSLKNALRRHLSTLILQTSKLTLTRNKVASLRLRDICSNSSPGPGIECLKPLTSSESEHGDENRITTHKPQRHLQLHAPGGPRSRDSQRHPTLNPLALGAGLQGQGTPLALSPPPDCRQEPATVKERRLHHGCVHGSRNSLAAAMQSF